MERARSVAWTADRLPGAADEFVAELHARVVVEGVAETEVLEVLERISDASYGEDDRVDRHKAEDACQPRTVGLRLVFKVVLRAREALWSGAATRGENEGPEAHERAEKVSVHEFSKP